MQAERNTKKLAFFITFAEINIINYDACACIGEHVQNTSEIGHIKLLSHDFQDGRWRIRFKLEGTP